MNWVSMFFYDFFMEFRKEFKHFIQISIILLGIGSFYLASRTSLLYSNMTYVGNLIEYRILFIVWGIAQSSFFAFMAYFISKKYLQNKSLYITQGMILIDTIGNILSYLFPYTPPGGNLYSQLHSYSLPPKYIYVPNYNYITRSTKYQ